MVNAVIHELPMTFADPVHESGLHVETLWTTLAQEGGLPDRTPLSTTGLRPRQDQPPMCDISTLGKVAVAAERSSL